MNTNVQPKTLDRQGIVLADDWGDIYDVGRIDELAIGVVTNPAQVRVSPKLPGGGADFQEPMYLPSGGTTSFDNGALSGFGLFQFRRATPGSASTVNFKAICKG